MCCIWKNYKNEMFNAFSIRYKLATLLAKFRAESAITICGLQTMKFVSNYGSKYLQLIRILVTYLWSLDLNHKRKGKAKAKNSLLNS